MNDYIRRCGGGEERKWIEENTRPRSSQFCCPVCHRTAYDPQPTRVKDWKKRCRYAYCPNCGAKMDGGDNDGRLIDAYAWDWISTKERMPDVNQPIMICIFGIYVGEGKYCGHDGYHDVWKRYSDSGTYWDDEVTHWMPLPEPPKEVDE